MTTAERLSARITPTRISTDDERDAADREADEQPVARPRQRVAHHPRLCREVLASEGVLQQADPHADRGDREAPVEAEGRLQQARQDGAEERAEVDAEVEQREARIAARVLGGVQRADHGGRVGLQSAGAQGDEHEADADAREAGQDGERDVPGHDDDGADEQHALRAEHPVGQPRPHDRGQVDGAAVGADDAGRGGLVHREAALGDGVVEVDEEDALHPVEAEALPHLDAEDVRQRPRLPEEPRIAIARRARLTEDRCRADGGRACVRAWPARVRGASVSEVGGATGAGSEPSCVSSMRSG